MNRQTPSAKYCLICGQSQLKLIQGYTDLPRVTSDCRAFPPGGDLLVCEACSAVQKTPSKRWLAEIEEIYRDYAAYSLADGAEQLVLDPITASPAKRSDVLVKKLIGSIDFPDTGRALDVGCGHGVTMAALSVVFPNWRFNGYELGEGNLPVLQKIKNFEFLYTGALTAIDSKFDLISMIHSLEHFVDPISTLCELREIVGHEGRLFVEVCNVQENPFDLLVADHLMHFSPVSLRYALNRAGFSTECESTTWVKKELSFVAIQGREENFAYSKNGSSEVERISASVAWLVKLVELARVVAQENRPFGIFGTSIAATWLSTALSGEVDFFVDEDPHRIGRNYLGKEVIGPDEVPESAVVFLALAPTLADAIARRLADYPFELISPPPI